MYTDSGNRQVRQVADVEDVRVVLEVACDLPRVDAQSPKTVLTASA